MKKKYLITYDLRKPGKNYAEVYEAIKEFDDWQHPLESVWVVKVDNGIDASEIYNRIRPKIDNGDYLFVVDITDRNYRGWLAKSFWEWYKQ